MLSNTTHRKGDQCSSSRALFDLAPNEFREHLCVVGLLVLLSLFTSCAGRLVWVQQAHSEIGQFAPLSNLSLPLPCSSPYQNNGTFSHPVSPVSYLCRQLGMGTTGVPWRQGGQPPLKIFLRGCQTSLKSFWLLQHLSCGGVPRFCQKCTHSWCCICWLHSSTRLARASGAG